MRVTVTGRLTFALVLVTGLTVATQATALAQTDCSQFAAEFAGLQSQLGAVMGDPANCPRTDASGDTIQLTSTGLAIHRPDGMSVFASGSDHWALTSSGLEYWSGNWHNGLYPPVTPQPDATDAALPTESPAQGSVEPLMLMQVLQDGSNAIVVEDPSGSIYTVDLATGCPDVGAAVGENVFVRSGDSQTDLILMQQHETCAVAAMYAAQAD
ncbi:MAG: hypothetical protein JO057_29685 [Chloroflexi bacterium]|nr:hypothetical protein [Chloroflexota bacterium]